jgi:hypothetical protein
MKKSLMLVFVLVIMTGIMMGQAPAPPTATTTTVTKKVAKKSSKATPATGHGAVLSFTQSTSTGITGNNVYQSLTSGGPYTKIFSSSTPITSYTVTGLAAVTTYYWVVTAVCATCSPSESGNSNQVQGTTSADPQPNAPSSLTLTSIN